jgi:hypothetical protein
MVIIKLTRWAISDSMVIIKLTRWAISDSMVIVTCFSLDDLSGQYNLS